MSNTERPLPPGEPPSPRDTWKVQRQVTDQNTSGLRRYQRVVVGSSSLWYTVKYEIVCSLGNFLPGALGLWARQRLYRCIFKRIGRGTVFGSSLFIRHPGRIELGENVVISDGCTLDARGDDNAGIRIGDDVIIGERAMLRCKNGDITIGSNVGIGAHAGLYAVHGNHLRIGDDVAIAPFVYLGGTQYYHDRPDVPIHHQGINAKGGIRIGNGTFVGAYATVLDGVTIGDGCIIGAGALVRGDIQDFTVATPSRRLVLVAREARVSPEHPSTPTVTSSTPPLRSEDVGDTSKEAEEKHRPKAQPGEGDEPRCHHPEDAD